MSTRKPSLVVIGGPNGAGKTTAVPILLRDLFRVEEFVNADLIAQGISVFDPASAAVAAGRVMLRRLNELARARADFAFESTLASRTLAAWICRRKEEGYGVGLLFLWLPSVDIAIERVRRRVSAGGHDIPEAVIRRRYERGLRNFFALYRPLADRWRVYDNSNLTGVHELARGESGATDRVTDEETWKQIQSHVRSGGAQA